MKDFKELMQYIGVSLAVVACIVVFIAVSSYLTISFTAWSWVEFPSWFFVRYVIAIWFWISIVIGFFAWADNN